MSWVKKTLGDISSNIQTGPFGSQLHQSDYSERGFPVVMPKDLIDGRISEESIARVSKEHVERLKRHKIESGDILYSRRGDVGRCAFTTEREKDWLCGTGWREGQRLLRIPGTYRNGQDGWKIWMR